MPQLSPFQLNEKKLSRLKDGFHADGGNLYLSVRGVSRSWVFRFKSPLTGKIRQMGIGSFPDVSLTEARETAFQCRKMLKGGIDPLIQKRSGCLKTQPQQILFKVVAESYINDKSRQWKGRHTRREMESLLRLYTDLLFRQRDMASITADDIIKLLKPLWFDKTVTATKLQGLLDRIFKYATVRGWFHGENPARWRGFLEYVLPQPTTITKVRHRKAYDWQKINELYRELIATNTIASLAACFICLTACRLNEARELSIEEIDFDQGIWTLPDVRNKTAQGRRIPLSDEALRILSLLTQDRKSGSVFLANKKLVSGKAILDAVKKAAKDQEMTVHGLRSSFRDWASEATDSSGELAEMILGHTIQSKVAAAYRRGDLLEKRRRLLEKWEKNCV